MARAAAEPLSLLVIDLDHFKRVNASNAQVAAALFKAADAAMYQAKGEGRNRVVISSAVPTLSQEDGWV